MQATLARAQYGLNTAMKLSATQTEPLSVLLARAQHHAPHTIQLGLGRIRQLMHRLDNPHRALRVVHVAGTNGKGSVLAFLATILRHAGYPVALYTSPHLQTLNERIQINGRPISDAHLHTHLETVLRCQTGEPATFFELMTAVALSYFRERRFDEKGVVLLETGLGGRLDATNVVTPLLSIITSIGMDHTAYLGTTLTTIAKEKAGIFKPNIPAIAAPNHSEAEQALQHHAHQTGTPLRLLNRDFCHTVHPDPSSLHPWLFQEGGECHALPAPSLPGNHQRDNAALAVAATRHLQQQGWSIGREALVAGMRDTRWPGRLEHRTVRQERQERQDETGASVSVLLDGAHNTDACLALARFLNETAQGPTMLVFSAMRDKHVEGMARALAPHVARVWVTQVGDDQVGCNRSASIALLSAAWRALDRPTSPTPSPEQAFTAACRACPTAGRVVVCGSLHLVGAIRAILPAMLPRNR